MDPPHNELVDGFFNKYKIRRYGPKEVIIRADESSPYVFYIKRGYVRSYTISEAGKEFTLNIYKPGNYFSMNCVLGGVSNTHFFETITPVDVCVVPRDKVISFLEQNPEVLMDLTKRVLVGLEGVLTRMQYLLFGKAYNKVASSILLCSRRFGEKTHNGTKIQIPLTHQDIANLAGLARETASVEIKKLERMGIIASPSKRIVVLDEERLKEESLIYLDEEILPLSF